MKTARKPKLPVLSLEMQAEWVHRHAGKITALLFFLAALAAPFVFNLSLKADLTELISNETPSVQNLRLLEELVGGTTYHVAIFKSRDRAAVNKIASRFAERVGHLNRVKSVEGSGAGLPEGALLFATVESLEELEKNAARLIDYYRRKANPFYFDLLGEEPPEINLFQLRLEKKIYRFAFGNPAVEEDEQYRRHVLIRPGYPLNDFEQSEIFLKDLERLFEEVKASEDDGEVTLEHTGAYKTRYDEYAVILKDLRKTGSSAFIFVTVIMAAFFRRLRVLIMGLVILGIAILWAGAFAQITIGYLNLISTLLLAILLGLGIDFTIHFFNRYRQYHIKTASSLEALRLTYLDIAKPLWAGALTTGVAFFCLVFNRFLGFSHFGLIAGAGILACCAAVFYGLPALIISSERFWGPMRWKDPFPIKWPAHKAAGTLPGRRFRISLAVVTAGLLFTAFSLIQLPQIRFDDNFENLQSEKTPSVRLAHELQEYFEMYMNPVTLITQSRQQAYDVLQMIQNYIRHTPDTTLDFAVSLASYPPGRQEEKREILSRIRERLDEREDWLKQASPDIKEHIGEIRRQLSPQPITVDNLPPQTVRQYEPEGKQKSLVYVYPKVNIMAGHAAKAFIGEIKSLSLPDTVTLAGEPLVYTDILTAMDEDVPVAAFLSAVAVPFLLYLIFRRGAYVFMTLVPVIIGLCWMTGVMQITAVQLNYFNAALLPGLIGVMLDNGIHILHRSVKEDQIEFSKIFQKTGKAVMFSGLTTIAAFASLTLAEHAGTASLGHLGVIGFASGLIAAVIFMPAVFTLLQSLRRNAKLR